MNSCFFFQAEDGIRDLYVTGVQTCALPISFGPSCTRTTAASPPGRCKVVRVQDGPKGLALTVDVTPRYCEADPFEGGKQAVAEAWRNIKIGRASCRERVKISGVARSSKKKE